MSKENKSGLIVFIVIVVIALAVSLYSVLRPKTEAARPSVTSGVDISFPGFSFSSKKGTKNIFPQGKYIAKLYITGIITDETRLYNQEWLLDTIAELAEDPHNTGIMLYLNTPGGGVYQSDEVYLALMNYKKETERPVYAYVTQMSASGGYYISCAADKIFANRNALTGSIGVIFGSSLDATELLQKIGLKTRTFYVGKNKNMLNIDEPLTPEQEDIMLSIAQEAYNQFTKIVANSRNMTHEKVYEIADGRIYSALQAEQNGLIDGVCTFDEAVDRMLDDEELTGSTVEDFEYEFKETLSSFFGNIITHATGIDAFEKQLQTAQFAGPAYYFSW